jgi:hypothetical protein
MVIHNNPSAFSLNLKLQIAYCKSQIFLNP